MKTAPPGGSASSLSLSDPSLGTPQSKTKTTPPGRLASCLSLSSDSGASTSSNGRNSCKQSVLSHFLPPLPTVTPSRSSSSSQSRARILTSKECLDQLAEKGKKKEQEKEEKEKRKIE